ncbi:unnamed protein product, partial [Heterotrigona itama]
KKKRKEKRRKDEKWYKPKRNGETLANIQKEGCINRDAKEERKKENGRPSPEAFSEGKTKGEQRIKSIVDKAAGQDAGAHLVST